MKNQLTTIAALPGSGAGTASALPAEKPMERARPQLEVTTIGASVANYFGWPALGGQWSPIIGSPVDPSEAAPEKLEEVAHRIRNREGSGAPYIDADDPIEMHLDGRFSLDELADLVEAAKREASELTPGGEWRGLRADSKSEPDCKDGDGWAKPPKFCGAPSFIEGGYVETSSCEPAGVVKSGEAFITTSRFGTPFRANITPLKSAAPAIPVKSTRQRLFTSAEYEAWCARLNRGPGYRFPMGISHAPEGIYVTVDGRDGHLLDDPPADLLDAAGGGE